MRKLSKKAKVAAGAIAVAATMALGAALFPATPVRAADTVTTGAATQVAAQSAQAGASARANAACNGYVDEAVGQEPGAPLPEQAMRDQRGHRGPFGTVPAGCPADGAGIGGIIPRRPRRIPPWGNRPRRHPEAPGRDGAERAAVASEHPLPGARCRNERAAASGRAAEVTGPASPGARRRTAAGARRRTAAGVPAQIASRDETRSS